VYQAVKRSNGNGAARVQRKFSILSRLFDERFSRAKEQQLHAGELRNWLSTYEIAKDIGMKPSGHLRDILNELTREGFIEQKFVQHRSNREKSMWKIASKTRNSATWKAAFDAYLGGLT